MYYGVFRTHHAILDIPSRLFYHNALIACAKPRLLPFSLTLEKDGGETGAATSQLVAQPLVFLPVQGQHEHEMDSPSFSNEAEIARVVDVCQALVSSTGINPPLPAQEIGVIAAFRRQVLKIRTALRNAGLATVNVGGVEDFQGQEVTAVVISTVLTSPVQRFANSKVKSHIH